MGLLSKAEKARNQKLDKLTKQKKKYVHNISSERKKVLHKGIKTARKKITKALGKKVEVKDVLKKPVKLPVEKKDKLVLKKGKVSKKTPVSVVESAVGKKKGLGLKAKISQLLTKTPVQAEVKVKAEDTTKATPGKKKLFDISAIKSQISSEFQRKRAKVDPKNFMYTGIEGFDALLDYGVPKNGSILIAGGAGSGKTIFSLQTLFNQLAQGKQCIMMSFEESEEKLIGHMEQFGWDPKKYIKKNKFYLKRFNPFEITRSVDALLMKARGELLIDVEPLILPKGFKPDFIVVDSLTAIASAFTGKEESYRIYIEQLFRFFENIKSTAFLITETEQVPKIFSTTGVEEFLADGVVVIYNIKRGNIRERALEVLKLRGASHEHKIVAMSIGSNGVTIYPDQEIFGDVDEKSPIQ